jgi:murein DD-endopeptidase / murein LD-carboxypeptidase
MRAHTPLFLAAIVLTGLFTVSCHSRNLTSSSETRASRRNPQFIDDVSVGGNSAYTVNNNGVIADDNIYREGRHKKHKKENTLLDKYANMMGVPDKKVNNYPLYSFIDEWYGVGYRMGGKDKNGIDCSAFVQKLYQEVYGTNVVRTSVEQFNSCVLKNDADDLREGDLVFFRINSHRITHVGVYLMNNYFVHASLSNGVMISSLNESYWQRSFAGGGEVPRNSGQASL